MARLGNKEALLALFNQCEKKTNACIDQLRIIQEYIDGLRDSVCKSGITYGQDQEQTTAKDLISIYFLLDEIDDNTIQSHFLLREIVEELD